MSPQPHPLATTTTPADKPNPSYFKSAPVSQDTIQQKEVLLHLYAYQHLEGKPNGNQKVIVSSELPGSFGILVANDWTIYDAPADGPGANIIARAQGLHLGAQMAKQNWFVCFNMVFVDERFKGSSFKVMGDFELDKGEWAIVGGTGEFAYAQGFITYKKTQLASGNMRELHVRALCLSLPKPAIPLVKMGPWGKQSEEFLDVPAIPQRLERVTVSHSPNIIVSIEFSFTDQAGEKRTVGPWGGRGAAAFYEGTIELDPWEFVKQVYGTLQSGENSAIASLTIVTNVRTYGPYGSPHATPFNVTVEDNDSIVGFFAHAGKHVEALGVYVLSNW